MPLIHSVPKPYAALRVQSTTLGGWGILGGAPLTLADSTVYCSAVDGTEVGREEGEFLASPQLHFKAMRPVQKNSPPFCQQPASFYIPTEQNIQGQNLVRK